MSAPASKSRLCERNSEARCSLMSSPSSSAPERSVRRAAVQPGGSASRPAQDSPFPPIADYGFLSDCHTGALVASDGAIEWMCLPHFDSASVFAAMLDRGAGSFRVGPYGMYVPVGRRYLPGTNVLETTWMTPQGWLRVVDALTISDWHDVERGSTHTRPPTDFDADHLLVRIVECIQGQVQVEMVCEPMLDYGATAAQWSHVEDEYGHGLDATDGAHGVSSVQRHAHGHRGQSRAFAPHDEPRARSASARSPGPKSCAARARSKKPRRGSSARATSGAPGWPKATTQTTRGARTCSARRSR